MRQVTSERFTASGFPSVDNAADPERYIEYLDAQASSPFWREVKAKTVAALELKAGHDALDLGSGLGDEVRAMAASARVAVGVDASEFLVEEARRRTDPNLDVSFVHARAEELPFPDAAFDRLRVERTLQHVDDLGAAMAELWRVARPGARIVALEPDWDTLVVDAGPLSSTRAVTSAWADSIRNPAAGRQIARRLRGLGALDVSVEPRTSAITDFAFAEQQYALSETATATLNPAAARSWLGTLRERDASGSFLAAVTYFMVVATKPEQA
jgi:ubiquinone/menaquinone biosynthesis C-methylase UbiE